MWKKKKVHCFNYIQVLKKLFLRFWVKNIVLVKLFHFYFYSHTETSKLRQERLRQSLAKSKQDDLRLSLKLKKKHRELDDLRQSVVLKAIAQDPARNRKKETKEKLQNFK